MSLFRKKNDFDLKAEAKNLEDQRQKIISFKKFFGTPAGQEVMTDLMDKFFILNELPKTNEPLEMARAEGKRDVVLYLLKRARVDMVQLDKILKGEFV